MKLFSQVRLKDYVRWIDIQHGWNPVLGVGLKKQFSQVRHNV